MNPKTSLSTRLIRIIRLLVWLWHTGLHLRRLSGDQTQREQILRQMSLECLNILNVQVNAQNHQPHSGMLIVANHISWLDIFVLSSLYPSSFIAMKEIQNWWIIGKIVRNAGTVFIDRKNRKDVDGINCAIVEALTQGRNVCFFPEAQTSLGNGVLPLKAALFQSAINAQSPVQVVALRYYDAHAQRTEAVSFSGINLLQSLWQIVSLPKIIVQADCNVATLPKGDRFSIKNSVEAFLQSKVQEDSPNPNRLLP